MNKVQKYFLAKNDLCEKIFFFKKLKFFFLLLNKKFKSFSFSLKIEYLK